MPVFAQIVFGPCLALPVFTSKWWVTEQPQLEDSGSPFDSFADDPERRRIYVQVILGAGFRHKEFRFGRTWLAQCWYWNVIWTAGGAA